MDASSKNQIFKEWVNRYYEYGFRVAYKIIGNEEDSRDIIQDAFLKVWIKFEDYNEKNKFSTWFFTIVSNLCYDRLRRIKRASSYSDSLAIEVKPENESIENTMNLKEFKDTLIKLSDNLSPKQKIVFVLRDMEDLEIAEVCEITGMDPEKVKANLYYARKQIRANLISFKKLEERI